MQGKYYSTPLHLIPHSPHQQQLLPTLHLISFHLSLINPPHPLPSLSIQFHSTKWRWGRRYATISLQSYHLDYSQLQPLLLLYRRHLHKPQLQVPTIQHSGGGSTGHDTALGETQFRRALRTVLLGHVASEKHQTSGDGYSAVPG